MKGSSRLFKDSGRSRLSVVSRFFSFLFTSCGRSVAFRGWCACDIVFDFAHLVPVGMRAGVSCVVLS